MLTSKVFPHSLSAVGVIIIIALEQVGKEKQFEDEEKYSQFGKNENPQRASHGHPAETVGVKPPHLICAVLDTHCQTNNLRSAKVKSRDMCHVANL